VAVCGNREPNQILAVLLDPDMQLVSLGYAKQLPALCAAPFWDGDNAIEF